MYTDLFLIFALKFMPQNKTKITWLFRNIEQRSILRNSLLKYGETRKLHAAQLRDLYFEIQFGNKISRAKGA